MDTTTPHTDKRPWAGYLSADGTLYLRRDLVEPIGMLVRGRRKASWFVPFHLDGNSHASDVHTECWYGIQLRDGSSDHAYRNEKIRTLSSAPFYVRIALGVEVYGWFVDELKLPVERGAVIPMFEADSRARPGERLAWAYAVMPYESMAALSSHLNLPL